jgi:ABC-type multidrug transport system fused ATPase/permease subunit
VIGRAAREGRVRATLRILRRYARRHSRWFALGTVGSVGVVACRLAIPWPLRWVLEGVAGSGTSTVVVRDSILRAALVYLGIAVALGIFELIQRVDLGRFTSLLVRDLRSAAVRGASLSGPSLDAGGGDLTASVVSDSARLRADLNGVLIHASTNGLLFLAVSAVMFWVSPFFGALFLGSGLVVFTIGWVTSRAIERNARRQRVKEGRYAETLRALLEGPTATEHTSLGAGGTQREMRAARLMGRASLLAHGILGAAVSAGLLMGARSVQDGTMTSGELFLFVAYALTLHRRMVQVGRQTARFGKVVATTNRLASLIRPEVVAPGDERVVLDVSLQLRDLRLPRGQRGRRSRLEPVDTSIGPRSRVAVVGPLGSGKTQLLRLLAGHERPRCGEILWDAEPIPSDTLARRVGFLPARVTFPRQPLHEALGLTQAAAAAPEIRETLRGIGVGSLLRGFSAGWEVAVGSADLSPGESYALVLARLVLSNPCSLWVLDGAVEGLSRRRAERRIDAIVERAAGRALVMSMSHATGSDRFDRIIGLRRGRVVFDGPPAAWKTRERAA